MARMAAKFAAPSPPASVPFLLADGTLLTATVRTSARARRTRLSLSPGGALTLTVPQGLSLQLQTSAGRVLLVETPGLLRLYGATAAEPCALALQHWCRKQAEAFLPTCVANLARRGGFALERTRVRDQRSRWGSCTRQPASDGTPAARISLNWRALLLPTPLLEHLCWHELCHLRHMNHSPAYRAELARYSPRWPEQEKALNLAWRSLPRWALHREG